MDKLKFNNQKPNVIPAKAGIYAQIPAFAGMTVRNGFSLLEIVIAVGIFAIFAPAVALLVLGGVKGITGNEQKIAAVDLAQEGLEAAESIRDYAWANLTTGAHGLWNSNGYWEFNGTSETIGAYTRTVTVNSVDSDRRDIVANVTWSPGHSYSATTRLTNWRAGPVVGWVDSTSAQFSGGTVHNVQVISQGDGALQIVSNDDEGDFKSAHFNTGIANPHYQALTWVQSGNPAGTIKFRIKTSNSDSGLGSAVWLGPDGTKNTYYTVSGTPIVTQGGTQWVQYQAFLDSPQNNNSPILESVNVQYVP